MMFMRKMNFLIPAAAFAVCMSLAGCSHLDAPVIEQVTDGASSLYNKLADEVDVILSATSKDVAELPGGDGAGSGLSDFFNKWYQFNENGIEHIINDLEDATGAPESPQEGTQSGEGEDFITDAENVAKNAFDEAFSLSQDGSLTKVELQYVVDGDTVSVKLNGDEAYIRLIGINTPESVHLDESRNTEEGREASAYTKELLSGYSSLYLEFDKGEYDDYGRILAYVWLDADTSDFNNMLNVRLLRDGVAELMTIEPNTRYAAVFASFVDDGK